MRRLAVALGGLAATLAITAPAHAAAWLAPPQPVSAGGGLDALAPLRAVADPGKDVFLAWKRDDFIEVGVRPAGGSFGISTLYGCPTNPPTFCSTAHDADVAVDSAGNAIVVFVLDESLKAFVRPAGGSFRELDNVATAVGLGHPDVGFMPDGTALVVWHEENAGLYASERPPGGTFGAPTPIFTESGGEEVTPNEVRLATGGPGNAVVAFKTSFSPGSATVLRLRATIRTPAGWTAAEQILQESFASDSTCLRSASLSGVSAAMDGAGNSAIALTVFRSELPGPDFPSCIGFIETEAVAARRAAGLGPWTSPTAFDTTRAGSVQAATTGFTSQGELLVAWLRALSGSGMSARYAVGPAGDTTFGSAADVPGSTATGSMEALGQTALVPLAGGSAMVGYIHATATDWKLEYASRPAGQPFGPAASAASIAKIPGELTLGATPAGDVVAAWLEDDDAGVARVRSLIYDASPPVIGDVEAPANADVGQQLAMNASATDAFSPVSFGWAFGDGATATGAGTSHTFASPGSFDVLATATDAAGNAASAARTVRVVPDRDPKLIGGIDLARTRFRAAGRGGSAIPSRRRRAPVGTRVSFRLSEAASVRFAVERARPGRRVRGRCAKPTRGNSKRPRCTRYARLRGGFTLTAAAGHGQFKFTGRLRNRKLRPGRHRLVAVATDAGGKRSAPARAKFKIVR